MQDRAVIGALNELIKICIVGAEGFRISADEVSSVELKLLFNWRCGECSRHADELRVLLGQYGADAPTSTTISGPPGTTAPPIGDGDRAIVNLLEHTERAEDVALRHYRRWLAEPLPESVLAVLQRHVDAISRHHAQLLTLRDRAAKQV